VSTSQLMAHTVLSRLHPDDCKFTGFLLSRQLLSVDGHFMLNVFEKTKTGARRTIYRPNKTSFKDPITKSGHSLR
jgi:hypothetical protein